MTHSNLIKRSICFILVFYFYVMDAVVMARRHRPLLTKIRQLENKVDHLSVKLTELEKENQQLSKGIEFGQGMLFGKKEIGFYATLNKKQHVKIGDTVVFYHVMTTFGNAYDSASGTFTCPRDGTYLFNLNILSAKQDYVEADIMVRNESKLRTISYNKGNDSYSQGSGSAIIRLSKGDVIRVAVTYATEGATLLNGYSNFSGYLLFQ